MLLSMIIRDITEQIQMVETLRESERATVNCMKPCGKAKNVIALLLKISRESPGVLLWIGSPIFIHGALEDISGYTETELLSASSEFGMI